jgi:DHA1 family tetracycline resistance protein-like MFS transporter
LDGGGRTGGRDALKTPTAMISMWALLSVIFFDSVSYSLILPILPFILRTYHADAGDGGLLIAAHGLMAVISAPALGAFSDKIGRKRIILGSLVGMTASYVVLAESRNMATLFLARLLAGAMAGNFGVVQAAAAESGGEAKSISAMSLVTASWALGFIAGPAIGAILPRSPVPAYVPGLIAAGACALAFTAIALCHHDVEQRTPPMKATTGDCAGQPEYPRMKVELFLLFGMVAMSLTSLVALTGFWAKTIFDWDSRLVSRLFVWVALCVVVAQLFVLPWLKRGLGERRTLFSGLALTFATLLMVLRFPHDAHVVIAASPLLVCGLTVAQTMCASLLSGLCSASTRGAVMGIANGGASFGRILGPMLCGVLFERVDPTAPYGFIAAVMGGWILWLLVKSLLHCDLKHGRAALAKERIIPIREQARPYFKIEVYGVNEPCDRCNHPKRPDQLC